MSHAPRLIKVLNKGLSGKLTLGSAPAGFGKTTLVSSWLQEAEQTAVDPTLSELLQSENTPQPQLIFTYLLNALAAQPQSLLLGLDDFHVITNSAILDGLAFLVDQAPPGLHLVITSRADPALPLTCGS